VVEGTCELFAYLWLKDQLKAAAGGGESGAKRAAASAAAGRDVGVGTGAVEEGLPTEPRVYLQLLLENVDPVYGAGARQAIAALRLCCVAPFAGHGTREGLVAKIRAQTGAAKVAANDGVLAEAAGLRSLLRIVHKKKIFPIQRSDIDEQHTDFNAEQ
jgi:hypothetical protein